MVAEDILKEVGLSYPGSYTEDGDFIVTLDTDIDFNKAYSAFDRSDRFAVSEGSRITPEQIQLIYDDADGQCKVSINADFMTDEYSIAISEV